MTKEKLIEILKYAEELHLSGVLGSCEDTTLPDPPEVIYI